MTIIKFPGRPQQSDEPISGLTLHQLAASWAVRVFTLIDGSTGAAQIFACTEYSGGERALFQRGACVNSEAFYFHLADWSPEGGEDLLEDAIDVALEFYPGLEVGG